MNRMSIVRKMLLGGAASVGILTSGAAFAADLPSRQIEPVAPITAPVFSWTGFYVGVNAGYAWNTNDDNGTFVNGGYYKSNNDDGGFTGGGQIGYNYQIDQFVIGVEADINYADLKGDSNNAWSYTGAASTSNGIEWFGTVRARVGFAIDRALIYGTGGFAYGGGGNDNGFVYDGIYYSQDSDTRTGWTIGAGVEYAFTDNITARVEGLYVNLGKEDQNYFVPTVYNKRKDTEFGVIRAGLNYKFNTF